MISVDKRAERLGSFIDPIDESRRPKGLGQPENRKQATVDQTLERQSPERPGRRDLISNGGKKHQEAEPTK